MKQKRRQKMWQEFKVLILASVGLKRHKKGSKEIKSRRHSCPPEQRVRKLEGDENEKLYESLNPMLTDEMHSDSDEMTADDTITDLNHSAAKHKIAIRPNNRRTPSRLTNYPNAQLSEEDYVKAVGTISRSASLSSLDFIQDCHALLKTKSHSFKALPTLLLLDTLDSGSQDQPESRIGPNVIMVRTLPHMKLTVTEEQQEKFRLSIANWCLANEGLRKSIQSLQPPASLNNPLSSIISSESLTSICSGLQAIATSGLPEATIEELKVIPQDHPKEDKSITEIIEKCVTETPNESVPDDKYDDVTENNNENGDDEEDDADDGLMNVNVKERRQYLLEMLNTPIMKPLHSNGTVDPKATMSRLAAKNAAIVKMAVQNLDNLAGGNALAEHNLETASLIAIEAANKVKMMVSKFDSSNDNTVQKV